MLNTCKHSVELFKTSVSQAQRERPYVIRYNKRNFNTTPTRTPLPTVLCSPSCRQRPTTTHQGLSSPLDSMLPVPAALFGHGSFRWSCIASVLPGLPHTGSGSSVSLLYHFPQSPPRTATVFMSDSRQLLLPYLALTPLARGTDRATGLWESRVPRGRVLGSLTQFGEDMPVCRLSVLSICPSEPCPWCSSLPELRPSEA